MDGLIDRQMDGYTSGQIDRWTDRNVDRQIHEQMLWMDTQMNEKIDRWRVGYMTDEQMDGRMDMYVDRWIGGKIVR